MLIAFQIILSILCFVFGISCSGSAKESKESKAILLSGFTVSTLSLLTTFIIL